MIAEQTIHIVLGAKYPQENQLKLGGTTFSCLRKPSV